MKCSECGLCWADRPGDIPYCHADPNWPAPCEIEEEDYEPNNIADDYYENDC